MRRLIPSDEAFDSFGQGAYHYTKTSCFGVKSMALYGDRKAFYDTKTTCFAVVEAAAYRSGLTCLSLAGRLLTPRVQLAYSYLSPLVKFLWPKGAEVWRCNGCISEIKINCFLFCISLGLH